MNISLAKNAGFCFGVDRAVNTVYDSIKKYNMDIYTYGPIIHNEQVTKDLEDKGVKIIENIDELSQLKDGVVIIRSHGVCPKVYEIIEQNKLLSKDMTCPYVKKIHKIVKEKFQDGYQIVIIGDKNHPEVVGINGWCQDTGIIVNSIEECYNLEKLDKACIVAQTTFSIEKWEQIKNFLILNKFNEYVEYNTICASTHERQKEAVDIANNVDAMIIVGGKNSSNTVKLYNICLENCQKCYHIETIDELDLEELKQFDKIGITAGASTPKWIIDEVISFINNAEIEKEVIVSEINDEQLTKNIIESNLEEEFDFSKELEKTLVEIEIGDRVNGEIIRFNNDEVIIDFGNKSDGILPITEFEDQEIIIGNKIDAIITKFNKDGTVNLSKKQIDIESAWEKLRIAFETNSIILVNVTEKTKGGVLADFNGLRIFVPISQLSDKFVDDLNDYIKTTIPAKIIKFELEQNNVVASSRVVIEENKQLSKIGFWESIHVGKEFTGKVTNITGYGAFIDLGGAEGLLHISEISHVKGDSPENHLSVDDQIEVFVKELDKEKERILLALKNRPESPWTKVENKYSLGDIIEVSITNFLNYGAFASIEEGIEGLIHISQISDKKLNKPDEILKIGQKVKVKIISIDVIKRRIGLSIKEVAPINEKGESNLEIDESIDSYNEDFTSTIGDLFKKN